MQVEMRVGTILNAEIFKEARNPAYKMQVDFGPELGVRKTSAQITVLYRPEELIGKQVHAEDKSLHSFLLRRCCSERLPLLSAWPLPN